ncbi:MAG: hypothetical protein H0T76_24265 [Nannocystis sp.]|nr:hypothetical protein [Nannocystis sp.]MBA3549604.1 hypothetical protein [Nannocystis sp.]
MCWASLAVQRGRDRDVEVIDPHDRGVAGPMVGPGLAREALVQERGTRYELAAGLPGEDLAVWIGALQMKKKRWNSKTMVMTSIDWPCIRNHDEDAVLP